MHTKTMLERRGHSVYPIGYTFKHLRGTKVVVDKRIVDYKVSLDAAGKEIRFKYLVEYSFLGEIKREYLNSEAVHEIIKDNTKYRRLSNSKLNKLLKEVHDKKEASNKTG